MKIFLVFISVGFLFYSGSIEKEFKLNSLPEIKETLIKMGDTTAIFQIFGREYAEKTGSRTSCGNGYSESTYWDSYVFQRVGVTFTFSRTMTSKMGKEDSDGDGWGDVTGTQSEGFGILLDSTAVFKVYNLTLNESTFQDVQKLKLKGKWIEKVNDDDSRLFAFVTEFVEFESASFDKQTVDSLNLDYDNSKKMNRYFSERKIKRTVIGDNLKFYKRLMSE